MKKEITAVVVGCGDRATVYCAEGMKDGAFKVLAAVDPDETKLGYMQKTFGVAPEMCFKDIKEVLCRGKIADCVINGTMDRLHVQTAIPFLEQGYDMLLEKPICNNKAELMQIYETAKKHGCKLLICHVLRYAPFYRKIKDLILSGAIGEVRHIDASERVGVAHASMSYIRGKWNNSEVCGSGMLLAKCCHDLDLLCWLNGKSKPKKISSFGGRHYFIKEKAPENSGTRCLVDCPLVDECIFSAKKLYIENDIMPWYPWATTGIDYRVITMEQKLQSLKTDNPHGECIFKTNANIVDEQQVSVEFENGCVGTLSMVTGSMRPGRSIYLLGSHGEIEGWASSGKLYLRQFDEKTTFEKETEFDFNDKKGETGGHFGGDRGLVNDFLSVLRGEKASVSCTTIADSLDSHLCCYAAEKSRETGEIISL